MAISRGHQMPTPLALCSASATTGDEVLGQLGVRPPGRSAAVSPDVEKWIAEDETVVAWTLTTVELVSALRRLVRERALEEPAARQAEDLARDLVSRAHVVSDVEWVKTIATRLLRVHALRAADALQLGAALAWANGHAEGAILHTFDQRLAGAASREGFRVLPEPLTALPESSAASDAN
jgi:predicted nucleic acid-binding protein